MASRSSDPIAAVVGRDRALVWAGVAGLTLLAWGYLVRLSRAMGGTMPGKSMTGMPALAGVLTPWTWTDVAFAASMWVVMMLGMMLPAAAPVILLFAAVNRRRREQGGVAVATGIFVLGYLVVWGGFSLGAALSQWGLHASALLSPAMATSSPILGGGLLIAAGAYQLTPLKDVCLARCRSPLGWLMTEWRDGAGGALRMGLRHGAYCLGCCWALMGLLFVMGVMNLLWVAVITVFVLIEKATPAGVLIGRLASVAMILTGLVMLGLVARTMGMGGM